MPRPGSIASDAADYLREHGGRASIADLVVGVNEVRRFPVPAHSVRSAIYQHLDGKGSNLFVRVGRGRYELRR